MVGTMVIGENIQKKAIFDSEVSKLLKPILIVYMKMVMMLFLLDIFINWGLQYINLITDRDLKKAKVPKEILLKLLVINVISQHQGIVSENVSNFQLEKIRNNNY